MKKNTCTSQFDVKLKRPKSSGAKANWAFLVLPKDVSDKLPRRGRTSVQGAINGHSFLATLDPDGKLGHWLKVEEDFLLSANLVSGQMVSVQLSPVEEEPEPVLPKDLQGAIAGSSDAKKTWDDTTTIARLDWIHWITSAKQSKTRSKRIKTACNMLASGKRRVCCFDPSGYYSKAFRLPDSDD